MQNVAVKAGFGSSSNSVFFFSSSFDMSDILLSSKPPCTHLASVFGSLTLQVTVTWFQCWI